MRVIIIYILLIALNICGGIYHYFSDDELKDYSDEKLTIQKQEETISFQPEKFYTVCNPGNKSEYIVKTRDLALVFQVPIQADICLSSIRIKDSFGTNLIRISELIGIPPFIKKNALIVFPKIDYAPKNFDIVASFELNKTRKKIKQHMEIHYLETFPIEIFDKKIPDNDPFYRYWALIGYQPLITEGKINLYVKRLRKTKDGKEEIKSSLVFQIPHNERVELSLEFMAKTITPNLEIAFSEFESIIIGDGLLSWNRFKYCEIQSNGKLLKKEKRETIYPKYRRLEIGKTYKLEISKKFGNYKLKIANLNDTAKAYTKVFTTTGLRPEQLQPYIQIKAIPNTFGKLKLVPVKLDIDNIEIYYPY